MKRHRIWLPAVAVLLLLASVGVVAHAQGESSSPLVYVVQPGDTLAAIAVRYGVTVEAIVGANGILDRDRIAVGQELQIPAAAPSSPAAPALARIPDTDPGPPFSVEIVTNRALPDRVAPPNQTYQVAGLVRNEGTETFVLSRIHVTFFDEEGFRGYVARRSDVGERHGATEAEFACLLLAPGETCPFVAEITAQNMVAFLVHPDALPTARRSAAVALSNVTLSYDGPNVVRISGTASNPNPFRVKNVIVSGVLLDGSGQIVRTGAAYVLQGGIGTGESVTFDVRIKYQAFASYQLYAQAERVWE
jgi:LysM repeat protein